MSDNNSLVRTHSPLIKSLKNSLQAGSLSDLVRVRQDSNIFLLLDCSGSMDSYTSNGKTRITGLRETVRSIQSEKEMRMVQFGFGTECTFITEIPNPSGGTPLHLAIRFAKQNGAGRAIVISDGCPDSENEAMDSAREFGGRIDVVFIGNPGERGEMFLKRLAEATGGEAFTGDLTEPKKLASAVMGLLGAGEEDDDDE